MRLRLALPTVAVVLALACAACVRHRPPRDAGRAVASVQDAAGRIAAHPSNPCLAPLLQRIVDDAGVMGVQRLHVGPVAREGKSESESVRVYWPQQHAILIVGLADIAPPCAPAEQEPVHERVAMSWYRTKARIDLDTDVVPTDADIGGSSYLVSRPWVERVVRECLRDGVRLDIVPNRPR